MNKGVLDPAIESIIILQSKTNNAAPTYAKNFSKNLLSNKYTGIIVSIDNVILKKRCR